MAESTRPEKERESAVADWLTVNEPAKPSKPAGPPPPPIAPDESYDILGGEPKVEEEEASPPVPPIPNPVPRAAKPKPPIADPASVSEFDSGQSQGRRSRPKRGTVEEVWTRWAEWGPDVIRLVLVAGLLLVPLYFALVSLNFAIAFLILIVGALVLGLLGYPLFVTMERPIRITPEQAIKDYFTALSHSVPHYRRMWLLLSSAGRSSPSFSSFSEFKAYWNETLETMKMGEKSRFNPFVFSVRDFKSEKSAGQTELDVKFTLNVRPRADEKTAGLNYPVAMGLVKGPDRMWYLDQGTMPRKA